jgi:hypothetical protein
LTVDHRGLGTSEFDCTRKCCKVRDITKPDFPNREGEIAEKYPVGDEDSRGGVGRALTLRAIEKERVLVERAAAERAVASEWYQSRIEFFLSEAERRDTMPPRRERQSPDREDRDARRRGRPAGNPEMERQIRDLRARLEEMETTQRHGAGAVEFSDSEVEEEAGHDQEEVTAEDASTERLIKSHFEDELEDEDGHSRL